MATPVDAIELRLDMLKEKFEPDDETRAFKEAVRSAIETAARKIYKQRPKHFDYGRFVGALDTMKHAADKFGASADLGCASEQEKRASS